MQNLENANGSLCLKNKILTGEFKQVHAKAAELR